MRIDVLTIFPQMFTLPFSFGIFRRAIDNGIIELKVHDIRDFTHDRHRTVDDYPYGGGSGMVLKVAPIHEALESVLAESGNLSDRRVILLTPRGRLFTQELAGELARQRHLVLICGHYEGVDDRVGQYLATDEISIGDYVLTGGEIPALVVIDAVVRLIPGVLGSAESAREESHTSGLLEYPQYSRPEDYRGWKVPEVLLSGNHGEIARWRREQAIRLTLERRPELLARATLNQEDRKLIERLLSSPGAASPSK